MITNTPLSVQLLHEEDIQSLTLAIHDWIQVTPLASTDEGYDWLSLIVHQHLEPFNNGYRGYN